MNASQRSEAQAPPAAAGRAGSDGGSWAPLIGSAFIVAVLLLLVLLISLPGSTRPDRLAPAPGPSAAADR